MRRRAARALALALLLCARGAPAVTLYDNGPVTDPAAGGLCDSGPAAFACGGTGSWTFYDDFALGGDALVTGFAFVDWFDFGSPADYVRTHWSLFDADPLANAPLAAGSAVAALTATGAPDQFEFEIGGLGIALPAGVYWLGVSNELSGAAITSVARVGDPGGGLDASKQSDGVTDLDYPGLENRAFRVEGVVVPEPATAPLLVLGFAGLAALRRPGARERARRRAARLEARPSSPYPVPV